MNKRQVIERIVEHREELQTQGIKSLALFGSVARDEDTEGSDVDVLVELSWPMGLFGLSDLRHRLQEILGVNNVDLIARDGLHPALKDTILSEAIDVI
jgi:predicted nucleotidyltransferase